MYFAANILYDIIEYASSHGIDRRQLEENLSYHKRTNIHSYDEVANALIYIVTELMDENLGLRIGEQMTLKATAKVDDIMLQSQTLEQSINNAILYSKHISDALDCSLIKTTDYYSVKYDENPEWQLFPKTARKQIMDMALISNVKSLIAYTDYHYHPNRIHFVYEKPNNLNEYYRLFNCSLKFNQNSTEIFYDRQIISRHSRKTEFGLLENLKEKASEQILKLPHENDLIVQLKKLILNNKPERLLLNDAAEALNSSTRTLQRQLMNLNTSYKQIEFEMQLKLAMSYLKEHQKSVEEISFLLGFSESSAFIRFFRSMTNQTPKSYQKEISLHSELEIEK